MEVVVTSENSGQLWNICVWDPQNGTTIRTFKGTQKCHLWFCFENSHVSHLAHSQVEYRAANRLVCWEATTSCLLKRTNQFFRFIINNDNPERNLNGTSNELLIVWPGMGTEPTGPVDIQDNLARHSAGFGNLALLCFCHCRDWRAASHLAGQHRSPHSDTQTPLPGCQRDRLHSRLVPLRQLRGRRTGARLESGICA